MGNLRTILVFSNQTKSDTILHSLGDSQYLCTQPIKILSSHLCWKINNEIITLFVNWFQGDGPHLGRWVSTIGCSFVPCRIVSFCSWDLNFSKRIFSFVYSLFARSSGSLLGMVILEFYKDRDNHEKLTRTFWFHS